MTRAMFDCFWPIGDINVVNRAEILVAGGFGGLVDARLIDHRVHADGGLAGANGRR